MTHKRNVALAVAVFILPFFLAPVFTYATNDYSELHLNADSVFSAKNLFVIQKSGAVIYTRARWGQTFVRVTVFTDKGTVLSKKYGGSLLLGEIKEGDLLNIEGVLAVGADEVVVTAKKVKDLSLQSEPKNLLGTVRSVNSNGNSFVLKNTAFGSTTIAISSSTILKKGVRTIALGEVAVGDKVLSASGVYDYKTNILSATSTEFYQDKTVFNPRNFSGTLKEISGTTLPASLTVFVGNTTYTVFLTEKTLLFNKTRKATSLSRFVTGDKVRFYGKIRQTSLTEIDAEVVTDLNL
ncbi:MAG: hypothetical protein KBC74_03810 [Candidatus Pacebacteria bacterium]|nr:hypothetical protein [Candidatus Paceibacterota bacterium]MBP9832614.1 hypothetical protein [Candidatus Paceibacterota bacterium]